MDIILKSLKFSDLLTKLVRNILLSLKLCKPTHNCSMTLNKTAYISLSKYGITMLIINKFNNNIILSPFDCFWLHGNKHFVI